MLNIALPKGRLGEKVYAMFARAGFDEREDTPAHRRHPCLLACTGSAASAAFRFHCPIPRAPPVGRTARPGSGSDRLGP